MEGACLAGGVPLGGWTAGPPHTADRPARVDDDEQRGLPRMPSRRRIWRARTAGPKPRSVNGCGGAGPARAVRGAGELRTLSPGDSFSSCGGGRCVRHATAATGRRRRRRGTGAARGRAWASSQDRRRRSWGRLVEPGVERGRPSACPTAKPAAARPTAFSTVLRLARAAMTCRPRPWDGQRVAPVVPPAGTVDRGDGAERPPPRPTRGVGVPVLPSHAELRDQG